MCVWGWVGDLIQLHGAICRRAGLATPRDPDPAVTGPGGVAGEGEGDGGGDGAMVEVAVELPSTACAGARTIDDERLTERALFLLLEERLMVAVGGRLLSW